MIEHLLLLYNPSFALAFFCLITAAMGAFLGANQMRIERECKAKMVELAKAAQFDDNNISLSVQRVLNLALSHTKLIHDLTPKKRKRK